jgi:hypothetical protein
MGKIRDANDILVREEIWACNIWEGNVYFLVPDHKVLL